MQAHTREYNAPEEWVDASPFKIESSEDFAAIPDADWDAYVKATTDFSSWEEMLGEAGEELVGRSPFRG